MKLLKHSALSLSLVFSIFACDSSTKGTEAEVGEAQEVKEVAEATEFKISEDQSQVTWIGRKPGGEHNGTIGIEDGKFQVKDNQVVGGTITLDMNDVVVKDLQGEDQMKLTNHLKDKDFFFAEQYPQAKFEITNVANYNGQAQNKGQTSGLNTEEADKYFVQDPTHYITGNLTMRDTTLSVSFPAKINLTGDQIEAKAKFVIDRTKWNVKFMEQSSTMDKARDKFIYNDVNVGFDIVAKK